MKKYIVMTCLLLVILALSAYLFPDTEIPEQLPRLYLEGDISGMRYKTDIRDISFRYEDGDKVTEGFATLKVQGNSSLKYDKRNFTIKLYSDEAHTDKKNMNVGWGRQNEYCLKANWIDKTHARNIVTANLAADVQSRYGVLTNTPNNGLMDGFPIEVYGNGEFYGLYTLNIPKDDWAFGLDKENPNHILFCSELYGPSNLFHEPLDPEAWELEVGADEAYAYEKLSELIDFVRNSSDEEFREQFSDHFNMDSALNYYVVMDFALLNDNRAKNMLLLTYDAQHWYLCLYDMDTSWGAKFDGLSLYDYAVEPVIYSISNLYVRMENVFSTELAQRYFELKEDILNKESVMSRFEAFRDRIPEADFRKEQEKWGSDIPGFDYDQIEAFMDTMIPYLDNKYSGMLDGTHPPSIPRAQP